MGVKQSDYPPRLSDDEYALVRLIRRVWPKVLWIARDRTRLTLHSDWPVADQLGLFTARPDTVEIPFRLFPSISVGGRWSVHDLSQDYRPPSVCSHSTAKGATDSPKRFYIFKDGNMEASTSTREGALDLIRQYQKRETHYLLRPNFSIIEGEEEPIPYPSEQK